MTYDQEYVARFWSKVDVKHKSKCWEWKASVRGTMGYGRIQYRNKTWAAHRVAWQLTHGEIGDFQVLHKCDNPLCCNPNHLFLGTSKDNINDMIRKRRHIYGERTHNAKLNDSQALEIFNSTKSQRQLSKEYGVDRRVVFGIKKKEKWKHIHE